MSRDLNLMASGSSSNSRSWHWASLHSWNIFSNRGGGGGVRSRVPPEEPPLSTSHPSRRPLRRRHQSEMPLSNPRSSSSAYTRSIPSDSPHRRRTIERRDEAIGNGPRPRSGSNTTHQRHQHDHHHHHHNHRYHYHLTRRRRGNPDRGAEERTLVNPSSGANNTISENEPISRPFRSRNNDRYRSSFFSRFSFMNEPPEAAREARERLDERLRAAALTSNRRNLSDMPGIFPDDFDFFVEDDDDIWSDEETWERGMRDWLAAWDVEERWSGEISPEWVSRPLGLTKAQLNNLARVVFAPSSSITGKEFRVDKTIASEQEDCPVCLEHFVHGQTLLCLPCSHLFHPDCLSPWFKSHTQCPYCRAEIKCETLAQAGSSSARNNHEMSREEDFMSWMTVVDSSFSRLDIVNE